jgi:hypothetical protein
MRVPHLGHLGQVNATPSRDSDLRREVIHNVDDVGFFQPVSVRHC